MVGIFLKKSETFPPRGESNVWRVLVMESFRSFRKARSFARKYTLDGRRVVTVLIAGAAYQFSPEARFEPVFSHHVELRGGVKK